MDRIENFLPCNLNEYKRRLSPFGQKILNVLANKWNTERLQSINNNRSVRVPVQRRRIINFTETSLSDALINDERQFHFDLDPNNLPSISTATQILQSRLEQNSANQSETIHNISRLDLLHPVESNLRPEPNNSYSTRNVENNITERSDLQTDTNFLLNSGDNNVNNVNWDNMFDTELLSKVTEMANEKNRDSVQNIVENNFKITFPYEKNSASPKKKQEMNNDDIKETNKKQKRKKQANNIDNVSKKMKKVSDDVKLNFRKQKYTKTVKNWLDNVNLNNPLEIECDVLKNSKELKDDNKTITTYARNDKPAKRVVQMQLANKEGKMKFDKPQDLDKNYNNNKNIPIEVDSENDNIVTKKDNPKKGKTKFVPPVKSLIPVKDITYEIYDIDSGNFEHQMAKLRGETREICAVLVYSNDFCQLNSQYTEDDCVADGIMLYINAMFYYFKKTDIKFSTMVSEFLEQNTVFCYDGKSLLIFLKSQFEFKINFDIKDIQIGGSLLDPDNPPESFADLQKLIGIAPQYTIATDCVLQKTAWYTTVLKDCAEKLKSSLVDESLWKVFVDIEMRLLPVIADMELRGILVNVKKLKDMEMTLLNKMRSVEHECHKAAGKTFQINSTAQVRAILYDELQLDTKCNIKIRETLSKGAKSTSETMLRELVTEHPLPKLILEYRRLHKAHATFLAGVAQHVRDNVIRPTWVQAAAATGRVACSNPNVQAIPKTLFSLQPEGSDNTGHVLLAADYKHVECRVFAHAAADTLLLHALHDGQDLFTALAAKWENKPASVVSACDRERTKRVVYASLYGAGARTLMDILRVSYDRALEICASFHRTFPSLKMFGRAVVARCAENGGRLSTAMGRTRRLRHVVSHLPAVRAQAERQAVNFIVQGTAADLCKLAMVRAAEQLARRGVRARLLLQIHDELVWEVAGGHLLPAAAVIKEVMENCGHECGMAIPLPVALSSGRSWGEMTDLKLAD